MSRFENLMEMTKLNELLGKKEEKKNTCLIVFAAIGVVAVIAGICYALYRRRCAEELADFDDEFYDEFEEAEADLFEE